MNRSILMLTMISIVTFSCKRPSNNRNDDFIYIGKKDVIHSNILNEDRQFSVYVPPYTVGSGKKFPVLYLLDGDAHFHSVSGLIQILGTGVNGTFVVPEMIVVAIPNTDRTRDLTPTHVEVEYSTTSGGNANFLKFIKDELMPRIEAEYPTNPYRVLVGHSFGGITAINALYTMPEAFDAYISIDPSLWWDSALLLKKADSIFSTQKLDNKYLFIGQANTLAPGESTNDHFGAIKEYIKVLESSSNTSGIRWAYEYYGDDSHGSVPLISEYDGLRFIFKDFNPSYDKFGADPDALQKNFAQYRMSAPEGIINRFGYNAMQQKNLELAQRYFQMNIDAHPESGNVYDSMGELLLNKGDTLNAITNYEKSLQLDPKNENARTVINKILEKRKKK